jgi:hypothetical protein
MIRINWLWIPFYSLKGNSMEWKEWCVQFWDRVMVHLYERARLSRTRWTRFWVRWSRMKFSLHHFSSFTQTHSNSLTSLHSHYPKHKILPFGSLMREWIETENFLFWVFWLDRVAKIQTSNSRRMSGVICATDAWLLGRRSECSTLFWADISSTGWNHHWTGRSHFHSLVLSFSHSLTFSFSDSHVFSYLCFCC